MINRDQDRFKLEPINENSEAIDFEDMKLQQPSVVTKKASQPSADQIQAEPLGKTNQLNIIVQQQSDDEDEIKKRKTQETTQTSLSQQERQTIEGEERRQQNSSLGESSKQSLYAQEKLSRDSFETVSKLGNGSYGKVYLVRKKNTLKQYALKCLDKIHIIKHDKVQSVHRERDILMVAKHPNIVQLECTFSDESNLYFLLEYVPNKSLSDLLKQIKPLPIDLVRFYSAELISALEFLHSKGVVHRDLKPENIMIDGKYHLKITDFGDSKILTKQDLELMQTQLQKLSSIDIDENEQKMNRGTFVGTPLYVSPEMLDLNMSGPFTDLWALGCVIYQMLTGDVPFKANYDFQVFQMITERRLTFPKFLPIDAVDLIDKLMASNPWQRLGAGPEGSENDYEHLKQHMFFKGINFKKLANTSPPVPVERFQSAFTQINKQQTQTSEQKENQIDNLINDIQGHSSSMTPSSQYQDPLDHQLQQEKEAMLIKSGFVFKKKGVITNFKRRLILTNQPRLYQTLENGEYKSDFLITEYLRAVYRGPDKFEISCSRSGKNVIFRIVGEEANIWVSKINRVIDSHCK